MKDKIYVYEGKGVWIRLGWRWEVWIGGSTSSNIDKGVKDQLLVKLMPYLQHLKRLERSN